MKTIGQVYQLKETFDEITSELAPSFDEVIKSYLGKHVRTKFKDPSYVTEITLLTTPLEMFLKKVVSNLKMPTVQCVFLVRGFGFGKTHSIILLWHLLNSNEGARSNIARSLALGDDIARETLVLGIDFSREEPFLRIYDQLMAIAARKPDIWSIKDPRLSQAVVETLENISKSKVALLTAGDLAKLIVAILENYRNLRGNPRLLLLVDELGVGIIRRLTDYIEGQREERYAEIEKMINFLTELYVELSGKGIPAFIIIALAEQDRRELDALYLQQADRQAIREKIEGLKQRLSILRERLSRSTGGLSPEAELSYDPDHAISIARHRVLRKHLEGKPEEELISYLTLQAQQYNLQEVLDAYKEQIRSCYPLSPSMVWLLRKVLSPTDVPKTEYVRTVLYILAKAAEEALKHEPDRALTISVKHLSMEEAGTVNMMAEFEIDWAGVVTDFYDALRTLTPEVREVANTIAKQILAKGATANILMLMEIRDPKDLRRYGVTTGEIMFDMLSVLKPEEAVRALGRVQEALDALKTQSFRIEEKEYDKQKFFLPSLTRTVYDKLTAFVSEQRKILEEPAQWPRYMVQANLPQLFLYPRASIPRSEEVAILLKDYKTLENIEELLNNEDIRAAQNEGKLAIIVVPPWDVFLFHELYRKRMDYRSLTNAIAQKLQGANLNGKIARPLHLIVLIPNLGNPERLEKLMEDIAIYRAIMNFLNHISERRSKILEEKLSDYEKILQKRSIQLTEYFEERRKRLEEELKKTFERQVRDAQMSAQKELVRLTRRIATAVLELFEEAVFYSMQMQSFTSQNLVKLFNEISKEAEKIEQNQKSLFSDYSSIMNTFFGKIVESTGYVWDHNILAKALLKHYENEFESGVFREKDRIDELAENLMQGKFDIKPLSLEIARESINELKGKVIETRNKRIKFIVDEWQGYLIFEVEEEKPPEILDTLVSVPVIVETPLTPATLTSERAVDSIEIVVEKEFNYDDFRAKLDELYKIYGTLISSIKVSLESSNTRASFLFIGPGHQPGVVISAARFLSHIADMYNSTPYIEVKFKETVPQDKIKEILGPFYTAKVKRSWDMLLPT